LGAVEYWYYEVIDDENDQHFNAHIVNRIDIDSGMRYFACSPDSDSHSGCHGHADADTCTD